MTRQKRASATFKSITGINYKAGIFTGAVQLKNDETNEIVNYCKFAVEKRTPDECDNDEVVCNLEFRKFNSQTLRDIDPSLRYDEAELLERIEDALEAEYKDCVFYVDLVDTIVHGWETDVDTDEDAHYGDSVDDLPLRLLRKKMGEPYTAEEEALVSQQKSKGWQHTCEPEFVTEIATVSDIMRGTYVGLGYSLPGNLGDVQMQTEKPTWNGYRLSDPSFDSRDFTEFEILRRVIDEDGNPLSSKLEGVLWELLVEHHNFGVFF